MKIFGSWSIISFLRFVAQLIWAVLIVTIAMQFLMFGIFIYSGGEIGAMFDVYLDSSFLVNHLKEVLTDEKAFLFSAGSVKMSFTPLLFLFEWGVKLYYESHMMTEEIAATLPPFDFTLLFAGLICFVLAEILNQAAIMHEEQKLTV